MYRIPQVAQVSQILKRYVCQAFQAPILVAFLRSKKSSLDCLFLCTSICRWSTSRKHATRIMSFYNTCKRPSSTGTVALVSPAPLPMESKSTSMTNTTSQLCLICHYKQVFDIIVILGWPEILYSTTCRDMTASLNRTVYVWTV